MAIPTHGVPEGAFDDDGRVVLNAQLQIQDAIAGVCLAERAVAGSRLVPSVVLAESSVDTQVRDRRRPSVWAAGNELARHPLVFLAAHHLTDLPFVAVRLAGAVAGALEQAVIPLRVKQIHLPRRPKRCLSGFSRIAALHPRGLAAVPTQIIWRMQNHASTAVIRFFRDK